MTTTNNAVSELQKAQQVHGTDLAKLSARPDMVGGRYHGRSPRHSSTVVSSGMTRSRHPTPMSRTCEDTVRGVTSPRQEPPVSNVIQDGTQTVDIVVQTLADMPELKGAWSAPRLTLGQPCRSPRMSAEPHCEDEANVQVSLRRQEEHVPRLSVLRFGGSMRAPAVHSASAAAVAAPGPPPPQACRKPQQSQVSPLACAEQSKPCTSQWQVGNAHPGVCVGAGPLAEQRSPNLALATAGSFQRSRSNRRMRIGV